MLEAQMVGTEARPRKYQDKRAEWVKKSRTGAVERPKCTHCGARLRWDNVFSWNDDKGTVKPKKRKKLLCDPCQSKLRETITPEVPATMGAKRQPLSRAKLHYAHEWNRTHKSKMTPGLHMWLEATDLTNAQGYQRYEHYMRSVGSTPLCWNTWENYIKVKRGVKPSTIAHLSNVTGYSEEKLING